MSKKIMILGASILQLPAIQKAKEMGLSVVAVDMNPKAIGFSEEGVIAEVISTIDIKSVVECASKHCVDGVMTLASDMPMRTVAAVAKELNLVGISDDTALKATNKAMMRQALKEGNVPIPKFFRVSTSEEYFEAVKHFDGAFIVKPADNSGSRGIYLVRNLSNSKEITEAYRHSKTYSRSGDVVVEEYMIGPEVSVETLTVDGVCHVIQITDKITTGAPHFVEMGHSQPTRLSSETADQIKEVAIAANKAIGITNGPSHTEIIVTAEGPKIVELGARLGGDCITTHLVPLSTGVNMVECCIRIALGEKPDITPKFERGSAIKYFQSKHGLITDITGVLDAQKSNGVAQVSVVHNTGEYITEIKSSSDRVGFIVAFGKNASEALLNCENALSLINVKIEESYYEKN